MPLGSTDQKLLNMARTIAYKFQCSTCEKLLQQDRRRHGLILILTWIPILLFWLFDDGISKQIKLIVSVGWLIVALASLAMFAKLKVADENDV